MLGGQSSVPRGGPLRLTARPPQGARPDPPAGDRAPPRGVDVKPPPRRRPGPVPEVLWGSPARGGWSPGSPGSRIPRSPIRGSPRSRSLVPRTLEQGSLPPGRGPQGLFYINPRGRPERPKKAFLGPKTPKSGKYPHFRQKSPKIAKMAIFWHFSGKSPGSYRGEKWPKPRFSGKSLKRGKKSGFRGPRAGVLHQPLAAGPCPRPG